MKNELFILYGGPSSEREVSFDTKDYFYDLYKEYNPVLVEWTEDENFRMHSHCEERGTNDAAISLKKPISEEKFCKILKEKNALVIIAGHGEYMEDGYIQKRFEDANVSFTGSDSKSCKLAMNKYKSQERVSGFVKVIPTYIEYPSKFKWEKMIKEIGDNFPIFIKPNNLGSSVGAYVVDSKKELLEKIKDLDNGLKYLFQKLVTGREVSVGSIRKGTKGFLKLPLTEIITTNSEFFDYNEKYSNEGAKEITPANVEKRLSEKVRNLADRIHSSLGLGYYSRSDFVITSNKDVFYLETNPLPGMSDTSILPQQLKSSDNVKSFKKGLLKCTVK